MLLGLNIVIDCIAVAAIIFASSMPEYLSIGISTVLFSAVVMLLVVGLGSGFSVTMITPSYHAAVILSGMISVMIVSETLAVAPDIQFLTILMAITLTTLLTGVFLIVLGYSRWSRFVRFIPYSVIGGFMAGTGFLLTKGGLEILLDTPLSLSSFPSLLEQPITQLVLGASLAILLLAAEHKIKHFLVLPIITILAIIFAHIVRTISNTPLTEAVQNGWFLMPISSGEIPSLVSVTMLGGADWAVLAENMGSMIVVASVMAIVTLLATSGIELSLKKDTDLDQELNVNGLGNLISATFSGVPGHVTPGNTMMNVKGGGSTPMAAIVAAAICFYIPVFSGGILEYIPIFVVGALVLYLGFDFLIEWFVRIHHSRFDFWLIFLIVVIIALFGFLQGVGAGILIACLLVTIQQNKLLF